MIITYTVIIYGHRAFIRLASDYSIFGCKVNLNSCQLIQFQVNISVFKSLLEIKLDLMK